MEVAVVDNASKIGEIMNNCYGMEYFITNLAQNYLIAVNWYVIEVTGTAVELLKALR